ncbi:MAG: gamma-glutamyl-gamma-aminobutyrate hydrolase family protein [Roseiflexaceae bacterium]
MRPLIGIPCGTFRDRDWCPPTHGHRQTYVDAVVAAGGAPLLIPLIEQEEVLRTIYDRLDGLLLAGGGDIQPHYYGEEPLPELGTTDALRDQVEIPLVRWAMEDGKPVLGICRGLQVLNVALGGTLYQDIPSQIQTDIVHDSSYTRKDWTYMAHDIALEPGSRLAEILGVTRFGTNSLHHQSLKTVAEPLQPVGWAPDGVVEAVEGRNGQFVIGVQCHPEALQGEADPRWRALFRRFIEQCQVPVV